jgi:hypothetical protein
MDKPNKLSSAITYCLRPARSKAQSAKPGVRIADYPGKEAWLRGIVKDKSRCLIVLIGWPIVRFHKFLSILMILKAILVFRGIAL